MSGLSQDHPDDLIKPTVFCVAITKGCMFQCKMCRLWKENKPHKEHMDVDILYWKKFLGSLRNFVGKDLAVHFVGGETLTNDAALPLIRHASNSGCGTVLASNGYLINEDVARKIADSGLNEVYLSLDSLKEETHDFLRGVTGSCRRVLSALDHLDKYAGDVRVNINTVITGVNLEGLIDLAKWCIGDSRIEFVNFLAVTQPFDTKPDDNWHKNNEYDFLWPEDLEKLDKVIDALVKLKEENPYKILNPVSQLKSYKSYFRDPWNCDKQKGCHIYKKVFNVSANGQINMCFEMPALGNIKQEGFDLEEIWSSSLAGLVRKDILNCGRTCHFRVNSGVEE